MYRIEITLKEPLTAGYGVAFSNEIRSLDYIPATMLRGALYEELVLDGRKDDAESWFGPGRFWTPAWPEGCLPMPMAFLQVKRDKGLGGRGLINGLSPKNNNASSADLEHDNEKPVLRRASGWMKLDESTRVPAEQKRCQRRIDMHAGLRYDTQSVRGSALFSRESIEEATKFHAYVSEIPTQPLDSAALGKRHSVNGRIALVWSDCPTDLFEPGLPCSDGTSFLYLATDALLPGRHGGWLRGLDPSAIKKMSGADVAVHAASGFTTVGGWNGAWKIPREQSIAIKAGSCWRIQPKEEQSSKHLERWLKDISRMGLGVRCHEGFGRVCVNPPWLVQTADGEPCGRGGRQELEQHPKFKGSMTYLPWPGYEGPDDICDVADDLAGKLLRELEKDRCLAALHDLLAVAQRGENVIEFLNKRAGVDGEKGKKKETTFWAKMHDILASDLQKIEARHGAFLIMGLETLVEAGE